MLAKALHVGFFFFSSLVIHILLLLSSCVSSWKDCLSRQAVNSSSDTWHCLSVLTNLVGPLAGVTEAMQFGLPPSSITEWLAMGWVAISCELWCMRKGHFQLTINSNKMASNFHVLILAQHMQEKVMIFPFFFFFFFFQLKKLPVEHDNVILEQSAPERRLNRKRVS